MLFQHAGELSEFAGLLSELAVPVEECTGPLPKAAELEGARLVVVSGTRLLESGAPNLSLWPRTIAVIDDASKTLVSQLSRIGAAMVIRRPIHPRALRLLLLHEIYQGPERRTKRRVLIGHPIRLSSGLFRPHATLLDLSPSGARIELANAPKVGAKIRILIGKDLTKAKPVKLQGKVVRLIRSGEIAGRMESEIGVAIVDANRHARVIKGILNRFSLGPASWNSKTRASETGAAARATTAAPVSAPAEVGPKATSSVLPPNHSKTALPTTRELPDAPDTIRSSTPPCEEHSEVEAAPPTIDEPIEEIMLDSEVPKSTEPTCEEPTEPEDRRHETRIPYEQRIVALGEEAARVLVGRDLSRGGMRIAATPSVSVGDVLRVALHSGTQTEPIVIIAHALRDDGDGGVILSFDDLSPTQAEQLEKIIGSSLPFHANVDEFSDPDTTNPSIVVAEMIETLSSQDVIESDAEIDAHLDSVFDTGEPV